MIRSARATLSIIGGVTRSYLLTPEQAAEMDAPGHKDAAVLVPLYRDPLTAVFTERRADLRRHAGRDLVPRRAPGPPDEDLRATALREAHEEIGLDPGGVELVGALPPVGTFVTGYRIFPFVGLIEPRPDLAPAGRPRSPRCSSSRSPDLVARPRDAAADPQGRADQDADLHGRRPPGLGRDRADRRSRSSSGWQPLLGADRALDVLLDRDGDHVAPLGPGAVVVLHVVLAEQLVQHEPGVRRALADPAVGDDRRCRSITPLPL